MLRRLVAGLLAMAIRRWPASLRETAAAEWTAELHALASETGVSGPVRAWRQLRFAASLALARPPRGEAAGLGRMRWAATSLRHVALLVSAPFLAILATQVMLVPLQVIPFGYVTITPTSAALMALENYVVLAGVAIAVGTLLGRRLLRGRSGQQASPAQGAWAALPVIGGLLLLDGLARGAGQRWESPWIAVIAALSLMVTVPFLARGAAALSARGHRNLALAGGVVVASALTLGTMYLVVHSAGQAAVPALGSPQQLLARIGKEPMLSVFYAVGGEPPIETVLAVLSSFVFATIVVALAHAIRLARPLPTASEAVPADLPEPVAAPARPASDDSHVPLVARSPWWQRSLLGGAAFCLVAWAVTLTYLTPNIGVQNSWTSRTANPNAVLPALPAGWPGWSSEEGRLWMHELQMLTIVCAALCFLVAMAYRGRPALPAAAGSTVLIAANMAVIGTQWTVPKLLPFLVAGGILLGMAMWWWSLRRSTNQEQAHSRRLVVTVTLVAAVLVPLSLFPRAYALGKQAPPVLLLVAVGLPTVLVMLTLLGVRATTAMSWQPSAKRTAVVTALVAAAGVLYYQDGFIPFPDGESPLVLLLYLPLALTVPAAVATTAVISGRLATRQHLLYGALLFPAMLVAGYAFVLGSVVATHAIASFVLFPMEYGDTYDGLAMIPGAVTIGLALGFLTAMSLERSRPAPTAVIVNALPVVK